MSTPTRDQIMQAYRALTSMCELVERRAGYRPHEYERAILTALPPKPQPTMADVEWDDEKHYLAEAVHPGLGKVIMLGNSPVDGLIRVARDEENIDLWQATESEFLTPTGKRYTLTEVQDD
ncbi:hypothetical protein [Corynebacterium singulare]|uniref:hypothetical protein n=1 Tax=Corynebacterium singulare TaxID=161899 RepID=UPI0011A37733|nr:hypothetical protein [Corynebacterium singulare]